MVFLVWLLACILLTNGYKGFVTTDMCAPRQKLFAETPEPLLEHNFTLFSDMTYLGQAITRKYFDAKEEFEGKRNLAYDEKRFNPWIGKPESSGPPESLHTKFGMAIATTQHLPHFGFSEVVRAYKDDLYMKLVKNLAHPRTRETVLHIEK
jgi:hypothetical protein